MDKTFVKSIDTIYSLFQEYSLEVDRLTKENKALKSELRELTKLTKLSTPLTPLQQELACQKEANALKEELRELRGKYTELKLDRDYWETIANEAFIMGLKL